MHGTIVVKDSVLHEHPWVARSLYDAYSEAKNEWLPSFGPAPPIPPPTRNTANRRCIVGDDPLPYGIARNRATIEALESYAFKQQLIPRRMSIDELFVDSEMT